MALFFPKWPRSLWPLDQAIPKPNLQLHRLPKKEMYTNDIFNYNFRKEKFPTNSTKETACWSDVSFGRNSHKSGPIRESKVSKKVSSEG